MYGGGPPYGQQAGGAPPHAPSGGGAYGYPPQGGAGGGSYPAPGYGGGGPYGPPGAPQYGYGGGGGGGGGGAYEPGYIAGPMGGPDGRPHWQGGGGGGGGYGSGGRFSAVRLRGLPFGVREFEVAMFLGLEPIDIVLGHRNGRATGEAIALLTHPAELDIAMRKNKAYMGSRYIEVFEARKMDYYRMVSESFGAGAGGAGGEYAGRGRGGDPSFRDRSRSPLARGGGGGGHAAGSSKIVKLRGLPFSAGIDQILDFFDDPNLGLPVQPTADQVTIATGHDGRPNGMAFVEFESPEAAGIALGKDRQLMGSRYIEIFISNEDERARFIPVGGGGGPKFI